MHTSAPDVSIIILSYNTCELTQRCAASLCAEPGLQALTHEIIVVDNASTDNTSDTLRSAYPRTRIIRNDRNLGFAQGNNVGLAAARGRYLLLLNSDTEVRPGAVRALVEFMEAHPEAGACGPMLLNPDGTLQPSGRALPGVWQVFIGMTRLYRLWKRDFYLERGRDYTQTRRVEELSGAALLIRREVYEKLGGFDPGFFAYYEDVDWCKRMGDAGYTLYYVPAARVIHQWQGTSRAVSELAYRAGQYSLRYYFAKHHGGLAQRAIQIMLLAKETAYIAACTVHRNRDQRRFHQRMLAQVRSPLPGRAARDNHEPG
jgi:N-acetylglucosaminyl-diphospho-decaprenol L-rhamnosyltransferase